MYERLGVFFAANITDYIEAVHADELDSVIGQIAVCKQQGVHAAPQCRLRNAASGCATEGPFLGAGEMRIEMSTQLYA
jgi:hypothetical protein